MEYPIDHGAVPSAFPEFVVSSEPLGEGGMKSAFPCRVVSDGTDAVLKVVRQPLPSAEEDADPDLDGLYPTIPERTRREILVMSEISNPRVVTILHGPESRIIDGARRLWYLEPFLSGGCLAGMMGSPWPEPSVKQLGLDLLEGVVALWDRRVVHRDIKPANIVLDASGSAVLIDLGIALLLDLTPVTESFGPVPRTPLYAAPEQWQVRRFAELDFRTDLFGIGLVMFEALTGIHPFRPDRDLYLERLGSGQLDEGALKAAAPSACMDQFLRRMLAPHQNQRYRKLEHAIEALGRCQ
jgi:serine/threonine protein kinase